ncbi:MAG: hypothetical protein JWR73_1745 [Tardiphaga sp.]|nr:hypothetical protein [Tardiphaga sp.]
MTDARSSPQTPQRRASDRVADASVALVTVNAAPFRIDETVDAVPLRSVRPDPSFVTHLIAIAERCPQTRVLRRASPQDAMAAYRSAGATTHPTSVGGRTRQDI